MSLLWKRIYFLCLLLTFCIYSAFVYNSPTPGDKAGPMTPEALAGNLLYKKYNCTACHQFYGLGGYIGPDITNVMSAPGKGEAFVKVFLQAGTQKMPNFHLSEQEMTDLIAYLKYVDKTGISPTINFTINSDGSVNYNQ